MRILYSILFFSLIFGLQPTARGQDSAEPPAQQPVEPEKTGAEHLDSLFSELKAEKSDDNAQRIARNIWQEWTNSGSATIDLLMEWTARAMGEKNFAVAEDLLTQITTLRPDYAEGWNRAATLHFMISDLGRSLGEIQRTLQLEPRHFGALAGLAAIMQRTDQDKKALEAWYRVLQIYPANENAQKAVIELEEKMAGEGI
jgi:tetratricopeptide (TPR) repeat protein